MSSSCIKGWFFTCPWSLTPHVFQTIHIIMCRTCTWLWEEGRAWIFFTATEIRLANKASFREAADDWMYFDMWYPSTSISRILSDCYEPKMKSYHCKKLFVHRSYACLQSVYFQVAITLYLGHHHNLSGSLVWTNTYKQFTNFIRMDSYYQ